MPSDSSLPSDVPLLHCSKCKSKKVLIMKMVIEYQTFSMDENGAHVLKDLQASVADDEELDYPFYCEDCGAEFDAPIIKER